MLCLWERRGKIVSWRFLRERSRSFAWGLLLLTENWRILVAFEIPVCLWMVLFRQKCEIVQGSWVVLALRPSCWYRSPGSSSAWGTSGQCTQCPLLWPSGPHPEPCCRFKAEKFWRCCLLSLEPADEAWLILTALHTIRPVVTASRIWPVAIFVFPYLFRRVFCSLSDRSSDLQRLEPEQEQQSDKRWTIEHQSRSWEMWQD